MTKKEIVKTISDEIGLTQLKTKEIVQKTFDSIIETLVEDRRIELRNFGVFEVKKRASRKARNPRTGDPVFVPAKFVVTFKPGKEMEARVRRLEEMEAEKDRAAMEAEQAAGAAEHAQPGGQETPLPAPVQSPNEDSKTSYDSPLGGQVTPPGIDGAGDPFSSGPTGG